MFVLKRLFVLRETERVHVRAMEEQRQREREKSSRLCTKQGPWTVEPDAGLNPRTLRSPPEPPWRVRCLAN